MFINECVKGRWRVSESITTSVVRKVIEMKIDIGKRATNRVVEKDWLLYVVEVTEILIMVLIVNKVSEDISSSVDSKFIAQYADEERSGWASIDPMINFV